MSTTLPPSSGPEDPNQNPIVKAIYDVVASVPLSSEPLSKDPKIRAKSIAKAASVKSALIAGGLALPPGPLGMLTIIPDLVSIWHIQRQMVSDIAACFGKQAVLNRELMVYCLFRHGAATIVREIATQVGERLLVRRVALRFFQRILQKLGVRITQRLIGRTISRWIPIIGAGGIAAYAYYDTKSVGSTAIDVFSRDIEVEQGDGEPEAPSQP